jgi:hypothetical protein
VYALHPGAVTIAEESTAWPAVSQPTFAGGLGFGFKWNMGWMHDTLQYLSREPVHRRWHHDRMTFGLVYAFSENFILPLSHDEVVHGKRSLLGRIHGDAWQQFATLRAFYAAMWAHPGKKLLFMGQEFAQGREWNFDAGLDWPLLAIDWHRGVQALVRDCNRLTAASARFMHAIARPKASAGSSSTMPRTRLRLAATRPGRATGRGRRQLHAGAAGRVSDRLAGARTLARNSEHRRRGVQAGRTAGNAGGVDAMAASGPDFLAMRI